MATVDPEYDYTKPDRTFTGTTPFGGPEDLVPVDDDYSPPDDFDAPDQSADEIEAERSYNQLPAGGPFELIILDFEMNPDTKKRVSRKHREVFFGSSRQSYESYSVRVRLGALPGQFALVAATYPDTGEPMLDDRGHRVYNQVPLNQSYTVKDTFELPPKPTGDPHTDQLALKCYWEGTSQENGRASDKGLLAKKWVHFIERLGFPVVPGQKFPREALVLNNWLNRKVLGTVKAGKPFVKKKEEFDKATGKKKMIETTLIINQIDMFKYSAHPDTLKQFARGGELAQAAAPTTRRPRPPVEAADHTRLAYTGPPPVSAPQSRTPAPAAVEPEEDDMLANV